MDDGLSLKRLFHSPYLRSSLFYVTAQYLFQILIGLTQVWILTRHLPREAYGVWGYVAALGAMAGIFTLPGVSQAITHGAAHAHHGVLTAGLRLRLRYGILATLSLVVLSWLHRESEQPLAAELLLVLALFMPLCQALESVESFLTGLGRFRALFWRRVGLHLILTALLLVGAATTRSALVCALVLYAGGAVVSGLLFIHLLKYRENDRLPENFAAMTRQFSLQGVAATISHAMERPLLARFVEFQQMATYNMALTAQTAVSFGRLIDRILLGRLTRLQGGEATRSRVWSGMGLVFLLSWPVWFALVTGVRLLVPLLFPAYVDAIPLMEILLLQIPFAWSARPGMNWLMANPETLHHYHQLVWGIIIARMLLITLGAATGGMSGVAWAWVGVEVSTLLAVIIISARRIRGVVTP